MPNFILAESMGKFDTLYGKYEAPIVSAIEDAEEAFQAQQIGLKIFREVKSDTWANGYTSTTAMDNWKPVGENGARPTNGFEQGYPKTIVNMTWKSQFSISRELADDNQIGEMTSRARKFTTAFYRTREEFMAQALGEAIKGNSSMTIEGMTFDLTGADGAALFATGHVPKVSGGNQSNKYADAFSADALFAGSVAMQNLRGDNGEILNIVPDMIIIPNIAALKKAVMVALESVQVPGSGNNDANLVNQKFDVYVWPYLNKYITASTSPWLLGSSAFLRDNDCAIFQNRVPLEISTEIGNVDEYQWNGYSRFTAGFVDWRGLMAFGITGGSSL